MPIAPIIIDDVRAARERIGSLVRPTPLVPLPLEGVDARVFLKLENMHPIGSFKIRGAASAMRARPDAFADGVYTASAGNMAQGVAWVARALGVPAAVVVPDSAPAAKLDAVRRLGAEIVPVPFDTWWRVMMDHHYDGVRGAFLHPVCDRDVIAGNGTVGLEIVEQCPDVDTVIVPYGGGGLSCGIATAVKSLAPRAKIFAAEVETAAPLAPSLAANERREAERTPSFVDGIGSTSVLEEMWPLVRELIDASVVVTLDEIKHAIRTIVSHARVVPEGAGAAPLAAAMTRCAGNGTIVCVVSGGNIDADVLAEILSDSN